MSAAALIFTFQILSVSGSALTAAKLFKTGLYRKYRFFFWYLLFRIPNGIWPLFFNNFFNTRAELYFCFWVATEPIAWLFHTAVVLELYRLVLEKHKGLYTLGRWAMLAGIGTSVSISLASLIPKLDRAISEQSKTMFWFFAMERGLMLGLAILLLFLMAFLILYTVPISQNVKVHAWVYSTFFVANYLTFLLQSLFGLKVLSWTNVAADGVSAACVFAWLWLLNPAGELLQTSMPVLGAHQESRVLQQLDALNTTLLKVSKK